MLHQAKVKFEMVCAALFGAVYVVSVLSYPVSAAGPGERRRYLTGLVFYLRTGLSL